ncbi:MAG: hypothetical protein OXI46_11380 [Gemmatimonadota bacterium]|nr:hypothetical protein [Gemmatimonadota bacterium]
MRSLGFALVVLSLAGCGGGSGGGPGPVQTPDVQTLTGSQAPVETAADQNARAPAMLARADFLAVTTLHGETSDSNIPTFKLRSSCSATRCTFTEPQSGYGWVVDTADLEFSGETEAILTKHGITMGLTRAPEYRGYASWMTYGAFGVGDERATIEGVSVRGRYALAGGDLTGSRPSGSATWRGLMAGTPATGVGRGQILQGDATLTYRLSGTLDASFTNIKNIDTLRAHAVTSARFTGIPVAANGTFSAGGTGNKIQGGFHGSGHSETTGVFEQSGIVGAFGAKRQ